MTNKPTYPKIDTSNENCAVVCTIVSNPAGVMRADGDGWQKRVNDLIRALRDERNKLIEIVASARLLTKECGDDEADWPTLIKTKSLLEEWSQREG